MNKIWDNLFKQTIGNWVEAAHIVSTFKGNGQYTSVRLQGRWSVDGAPGLDFSLLCYVFNM